MGGGRLAAWYRGRGGGSYNRQFFEQARCEEATSTDFAHALGACSGNSSIVIRPAGRVPIWRSRKTRGFTMVENADGEEWQVVW